MVPAPRHPLHTAQRDADGSEQRGVEHDWHHSILSNQKAGRKVLRRIATNTYSKRIFIFGCITLSLFLLHIGIANSIGWEKRTASRHSAGKARLGIREDGTVRLVTATLGNQVRSVDRYPLESGVTDLPDSLPVTEQTRIQYPGPLR